MLIKDTELHAHLGLFVTLLPILLFVPLDAKLMLTVRLLQPSAIQLLILAELQHVQIKEQELHVHLGLFVIRLLIQLPVHQDAKLMLTAQQQNQFVI